MSRLLPKRVHEYFHSLMFELAMDIEPKFAKGHQEHSHAGMLWDMPDDVLEQNFNDEIKDAIVYWAEIQRRRRESTTKSD